MKVKKVATLLMAVVMTMSVMAGCGSDPAPSSSGNDSQGGQEESSKEGADAGEENNEGNGGAAAGDSITFPLAETMEFTCFSGLNGENALENTLTMQVMMEDANIHVSFDNVLTSEMTEKRNLILASGEYPELFIKAGFGIGDLTKYGGQGILIPLEDLIRQYAPNLTAVLDERDAWQYMTSADGHIYSLPEIGRQEGAITTYWLNKRWMDNLGLKEPTSFDELYDVLKAFKEQDANGNGDPDDEIPWFANAGVTVFNILAYEDYAYDQGTRCAVIDGNLTYIPTDDRFKNFIEFVTKCYADGLLNQDCFTVAHDQQGAIGQTGDVLGSFFDAGAFLTVGRDNDDDYIALTPFQKGSYPLNTGITPGTLAITDKCENPEVVIAWFDRLYSQEGGMLAWLGVEGKTYQINDEGDWEWILDGDYGSEIADVRASATMQGAINHPSIIPDFWYSNMSAAIDPDEVYLNGERLKIAEGGKVPLPMMRYEEADNAELATLKTDIDSYITTYVAQVATGEGGMTLEGSWDEYIETMKAMNVDRMIEIYQKTYDAGK
ncbi:type 2 periplasmic-binding domain-containing protein [Acetatifactor aquisgranensis]|uniref:extracellular solute-binding protein n=1 Tax=Acetatifactor aquisgranensis TaxID=2941233 RepID=UPI00203C7417|nr:extracellular solute-binding protein [Acetatifactor aquisgranensis]MCI8542972.1 extracellular solute-binding protein [Lachnospiraceae bacterium]